MTNDSTYESSNDLYHYGVLGMKWGVRRARRKDAKKAYKKATNKAFAEYEKTIGKIEKSYKRGQNLSDKDYNRERAAEIKYNNAVKKAKSAYKQAKTSKDNDLDIANRLYSRNTNKTNKAITKMSTGKAIAQSMCLGSFGALAYNKAKARGESSGRAIVEGIVNSAANSLTFGIASLTDYLDNVSARHK